jgi:hypothetical protein
MLATVINALALQDALERVGVPTRVMTAISIQQVAEPYIRRRAIRHLERGHAVIFAAGTGNPFFSTDTAAALRAMEMRADGLLKATKVDGIYDRDPVRHKEATLLERVSYDRFLADHLGVMDATAVALCRDNGLRIHVFRMSQGNIRRVCLGEHLGTTVPPIGLSSDPMWQSLPEFGTGVLYAVLVTAAYTFAVALAAGRGQPRLLQSARYGAYATAALTLFAVALLAYAFITHDFRIRYVARYSDRSMPTGYLFTALWGGQDGSLLWWTFLLAGYTAACVAWLRGRYRHLQPYVIATLMAIFGFFGVLMLFAANPFEASIAGARPDGEGLNPLLQNYWMVIHPPSLYMGFVGCSVPFAFCVAALATGRLDNEWIVAVRKWMLFAFLFLSIGNGLGMAWAYEELGWGG